MKRKIEYGNLIKTKILSSNEPIEFIGTILSKGIRTITQRTKNNLWKNIHYFNELKIESIKDINDKIIPKLNSSFGYLKWFDEYELKKINAKDTKYDKELSKLETERTAIKQEMDSIKTVKNDNIERTFGIFS